MSMRELGLAVRDYLRGTLGYRADQCECMFDGRPPPKCGDLFLSVHDGDQTSHSRTCLDERFTVIVTITQRAPKEPFDRMGTDLVKKAAVGLNSLAQQIAGRIHGDTYTIMNAANVLLGCPGTVGQPPNPFYEPLFFQRFGPVTLKGGDWLHADPEEHKAVLVQDIVFGKARRTQPIEVLGTYQ